MDSRFSALVVYILVFCVSVALGFYLLSRAKRLFLFIKPELLRRNVVTYLIGLCFFVALGHLIPDFSQLIHQFGWLYGLVLCAIAVFFNLIVPYNIVIFLTESRRFAGLSPLRLQLLIFASIVVSTMVINGFLNYWINGTTKYLKYSVLWSFYISGFGTVIYLFLRQMHMEKQKKLFAKELELSRLNELKTKAELDALHAKINPHFLYNALNSIADLAVSDGEKARWMTLSLADLFRYSINYTSSNYAMVEEEVSTIKQYLNIEKIRFEDRLDYSIVVEEETKKFLIPRFLLQPLMENAVKHGLKSTGKKTDIRISVTKAGQGLTIKVCDNGPPFPQELIPGYGLKNVFDKLDLLFPNRFEVKMQNEPEKCVFVHFSGVSKNEPTV